MQCWLKETPFLLFRYKFKSLKRTVEYFPVNLHLIMRTIPLIEKNPFELILSCRWVSFMIKGIRKFFMMFYSQQFSFQLWFLFKSKLLISWDKLKRKARMSWNLILFCQQIRNNLFVIRKTLSKEYWLKVIIYLNFTLTFLKLRY